MGGPRLKAGVTVERAANVECTNTKKREAFASLQSVALPYQAWPLPFAALTPSFAVLKVAGVAVPARVVLM